jgi:hypothetical protein
VKSQHNRVAAIYVRIKQKITRENKSSLYRVIQEESSISGEGTVSVIMREKVYMKNSCNATLQHYGLVIKASVLGGDSSDCKNQ